MTVQVGKYINHFLRNYRKIDPPKQKFKPKKVEPGVPGNGTFNEGMRLEKCSDNGKGRFQLCSRSREQIFRSEKREWGEGASINTVST